MKTTPVFEIDLDRLWLDITRYLDFLNLAHEEDEFWEEYCAWKKLTEKLPKAQPTKQA